MRRLRKFLGSLLLFLIAAIAAGPVCYLLWGCFTNLEGFWLTFLRTPEYLYKFWNSLGICAVISFGQLAVSCMGGMALAKYPVPGRRIWIGMLTVMLLLPLQVTLVPNYLILDRLGLLDTVWALILPGIFSPLGTVVMWITFRSVSDELMDAAQLDGAGAQTILWQVMVPAGKSGVASVFLLSFIDAWNMVEQPMVFLKDVSQYPLSVFLASLGREGFLLGFHSGLLSMLPAILLLLFLRQELVEGGELLMER
uniref:carbohydrate ABC transporter permease n=1 Tax=Agathobacter sp. TaxID=2021311 RepID=UPI0040576291